MLDWSEKWQACKNIGLDIGRSHPSRTSTVIDCCINLHRVKRSFEGFNATVKLSVLAKISYVRAKDVSQKEIIGKSSYGPSCLTAHAQMYVVASVPYQGLSPRHAELVFFFTSPPFVVHRIQILVSCFPGEACVNMFMHFECWLTVSLLEEDDLGVHLALLSLRHSRPLQ